jgi:hypothetical protein
MVRFGFIISFGYGQEEDTLKIRTPQKAAYYALLCPGGGQLYNKKYLKAGILFGAEIYAGIKFNKYRVNYRYYNNDLAFSKHRLSKHRYLEKRNKFAWWVVFIYVYGMIDAVVDAHLNSFNRFMAENIELSETNEEE